MRLAERMSQLKAEGAYEMLARAQALESQGREVIHLEIGQPDFDTVPSAALGGIRAITTGLTRYNPPSGIPALRAAVAEEISRTRAVEVGPENVVIMPGGKPVIFFPMLALLEPGDEVIYPDPGFPTYGSVTCFLGAVPRPVPLLEENNFSFDMAAFEQALSDRTRLIILNSPSNPTGSIIPPRDLERIAEAAQAHDAWVLSDEIYSRLVYDGAHASIISLPGMLERTILLDGFSKTYAMTGWRLGYGVMSTETAEALGRLLTNSVGCTATFTQHAGLAALTGPQNAVDNMVAQFRLRRDAIVEGLNDIPGIVCQKPQGAFYVFPNVKSFGKTSAEMATYLLDEAGIAALPGTAFGQYGEGYLRLSYANSLENIERALVGVRDVLEKLG
ncbi:MAG: pyridoxal phosphate-dependent aminotransferase [Chloroflexota bacterium]|nr:pyridoxal phosphate-dependent aminotransferase [Chloroflexota bacterium]